MTTTDTKITIPHVILILSILTAAMGGLYALGFQLFYSSSEGQVLEARVQLASDQMNNIALDLREAKATQDRMTRTQEQILEKNEIIIRRLDELSSKPR